MHGPYPTHNGRVDMCGMGLRSNSEGNIRLDRCGMGVIHRSGDGGNWCGMGKVDLRGVGVDVRGVGP